MDPSAVNINVTVDDFDSVLSYSDPSVWQTPDPSSSSFDARNMPWLMGTYHRTDVVGASLTFNFTGPSLYIYGHAGPAYGSYEVDIDANTTTASAYAPTNASGPVLLFGSKTLAYAPHTLTLRNLGAKDGDKGGNGFLFDYLQTTVQLAPTGANVTNKTYEEDNSALTYAGQWNTNKSPNFSAGGTAYTNQDKASVSLTFSGSAVYVFGDKKNDHGLYRVVLDNKTAEVYNGISGCGGAFAPTCEQQKPTLEYFASNLDSSTHTLRIENIAGANNSFFDLDSIVVTIPTVYAPRELSGPSSTSGTYGLPPNKPPPASPSGDPRGNSAIMVLPSANLLLLVWVFGMFSWSPGRW
ncbi:hypothetical protein LshimejAT787_1700850 [Lyophyllum shimeji]|uniref:Uncharacterized protein n=1 Tax=Lyophyllum shimeji TaxID=47721 RepID=A0A9P3PYN5_LYOSH|nr:hypothetical protein LshimejAT787_1700850 [Lyophyllum shimeji]